MDNETRAMLADLEDRVDELETKVERLEKAVRDMK